jgi:hypothetical protein
MAEKYKILSNKCKCALCGDIIESKHRHDFVSCSCGEISTDGGKDYFHRSASTHFSNLIDMSEVENNVPVTSGTWSS